MQIVIADCSAVYTGRGNTTLDRGVRAIIIKADGSVSIHNNAGNKPLNYMKTAALEVSRNSLDEPVWTFDHRRESLSVTLHNVISDTANIPVISGEDDSGLVRDGTEDHLQAWLHSNPHALGDNYESIGREFSTGDGPVDLFVKNPATGAYEVVEVKRVATMTAVDQAVRYREAMNTGQYEGDENFGIVEGTIAALDIRPKAWTMAERKGIRAVLLPEDWQSK